MSDLAVQLLKSLIKVPIDRVHFNPANVREGNHGDVAELAESIREIGILQPLVVIPHPEVRGEFLLVAGHRRLEAAHLAGLTQVQCVVRADMDKADVVAAMLAENLHRLELRPVEEARAIDRLMRRYGWTQAKVAQAIGKSQTHISHRLALLELRPSEQAEVETGRVRADIAVKTVSQRRASAQRPGSKLFTVGAFDSKHPLGRVVAELCDHDDRRLIGGVGCPPCWERAIRDDERRRLVDQSREAS